MYFVIYLCIYISCSRSKQPSKKTKNGKPISDHHVPGICLSYNTSHYITRAIIQSSGGLFGTWLAGFFFESMPVEKNGTLGTTKEGYFPSKLTYRHETNSPSFLAKYFIKNTCKSYRIRCMFQLPAMLVLPELPVSQHMEPPFCQIRQGCRNFPGRSLRSSARKSISVKVGGSWNHPR